MTRALFLTVQADRVTARPGETVTAQVTVVNIGRVPVTGIATTAEPATCVNPDLGVLPVGEQISYHCAITLPQPVVTPSATPSAVPTSQLMAASLPLAVITVHGTAAGQVVTDSAVLRLTRAHPSLTVQLVTSSAAPQVSGSQFTFQATVTNTSDVTLTNASVASMTLPTCGRLLGILPARASHTYDCQASITDDGVHMLAATANFGGAEVRAVSTPVTVDIGHPALRLVADKITATSVNVRVVNPGDVALRELRLLKGTCEKTQLPILMPGSYTILQCNADAGPVEWQGTSDLGGVSGQLDPAAVKAGVLTVTQEFNRRQLRPGQPVSYAVTITNTSAQPVAKLAWVNPIAGCAAIPAMQLAQGKSYRHECTAIAPGDDGALVALVTASVSAGVSTAATSEPIVLDIIHPKVITATEAQVDQKTATWSFVIDNVGDVNVTDLVVTVSLPDCAVGVPTYLSVGSEPHRASCSAPIQQATTLTIRLVGAAPDDQPVTAVAWAQAIPQ